jgi:eukaryotic-like serine/threonine-protein kinase
MARFAPPNLLLFLHGESLMVQELDLRRLTLVGQPAIVADSVARTLMGRVGVSVADSGLLVYAPGNGLADSFQITRIDRSGREVPSNAQLPTAADQAVELSPDGKRLAFTQSTGSTSDIWIYDLERDQRSRLTTDAASDGAPIWSPDGSRIIFRSNRGEGKTDGLYEKAVSGATPETLIFKGEPGRVIVPQSWSPDGKSVVFSMSGQGNSSATDLWVLPLEGDRKPFPYLIGPYRKISAAFSPNGRWLAFSSNESGTLEVYVQPFPLAAEGRWQVSNSGGRFPRWRRDGKELDYLDEKGRILGVPVVTDRRFELGTSEVIPTAPLTVTAPAGPAVGRAFALMADGQQFVLAVPRSFLNLSSLTVVSNWTAGLRK